ncbi:MAG TPA: acyltransferase [Caulobacteraceae bacterium]|nr:acyltransferase [Caulobacteraceae bacterium]
MRSPPHLAGRSAGPPPRGEGGTILSVQYLRGAAALLVVFYHVLQWRSGGFEIGRCGVDIFFVISGFIMWRITSEGDEARPGLFLWRRATRIVPAYWVATLTLAAIALAWPAFLPKVKPQPEHMLLSLAFIPHLDPSGLPFPLLAPGWTLSYEAGFYLIFAAALLTPRRLRAGIVIAALGFIVVAGIALNDPVYVLGANPLVLEFAFGLLIGVLAEARLAPGPGLSAALFIIGAAALAICGLAGWRSEAWRFLVWGVPAAAVVAGAIGLESRHGAPRIGLLLGLGDASYSIYLFHPIAVAAAARAIGEWKALFIPAGLAAAVLAGLAGRVLIEKPAMRWLRQRHAGTGLPAPAGSR